MLHNVIAGGKATRTVATRLVTGPHPVLAEVRYQEGAADTRNSVVNSLLVWSQPEHLNALVQARRNAIVIPEGEFPKACDNPARIPIPLPHIFPQKTPARDVETGVPFGASAGVVRGPGMMRADTQIEAPATRNISGANTRLFWATTTIDEPGTPPTTRVNGFKFVR